MYLFFVFNLLFVLLNFFCNFLDLLLLTQLKLKTKYINIHINNIEIKNENKSFPFQLFTYNKLYNVYIDISRANAKKIRGIILTLSYSKSKANL